MASVAQRVDAYLIDGVAAPLARRAGANGFNHITLAHEFLRAGLVCTLASLGADYWMTGGVWVNLGAAAAWTWIYSVETLNLRNQGSSNSAAQRVRVKRQVLRYTLLWFLAVSAALRVWDALTMDLKAYSLLGLLALALFWFSEWQRAAGTPPPLPVEQEYTVPASQEA